MRFKELKEYINGDKLVKYLTFNPKIDTVYFTDLIYDKDTDCLAFVTMNNSERLSTRKVRDFIDHCDPISDNTLITVDVPYLKDNNDNIVRWIAENDDTIAINDKASEDVAEELSVRYNNHLTQKRMYNPTDESDEDFIQFCFDSGFTLKDFKQAGDDLYDFAKRTKEEFGLLELIER